MLLTLDVGNSTIHQGIFRDEEMIFQDRSETPTEDFSTNQLHKFFSDLFLKSHYHHMIKHVAVTSVVPYIEDDLKVCVSKCFGCQSFFLHSSMQDFLKFAVSQPNEIGADRIAACIAAVNQFPGRDILVIDMGTATVFDIVLKDRKYLSGAIFPGIEISLNSLVTNTAQLSLVNVSKPKKVIGKDTKTNLQSGLYYGHLGALKEIKNLILSEIGKHRRDIVTIATGGFAYLFDKNGLFDFIIPSLVLKGTKIAFDLNQTNRNHV